MLDDTGIRGEETMRHLGARAFACVPLRAMSEALSFLIKVNEARPFPLLGFGIVRMRPIPFLSAS